METGLTTNHLWVNIFKRVFAQYKTNFRCLYLSKDIINPKISIMKKSILNIGKALNKAEQKQISGGSSMCFLNGVPSVMAQCAEGSDCVAQLGQGRLPWHCINGCCVF